MKEMCMKSKKHSRVLKAQSDPKDS